jgi:Zn-dependent protease
MGQIRLPWLGRVAVFFLIDINLYWAAINLLPVWPLDGGRISRELFDWFMPETGIRASLGLSLFVAGLLAINALTGHYDRPLLPWVPAAGLWGALLFGMLAFQSFQEMQQAPRGARPWQHDNAPWERDPDYWKR